MLNQDIKSKINKIIFKISNKKDITLTERFFIEYHANNNSEVLNKLKRAQRLRRSNEIKSEPLTNFLSSMALNGTFKEEHFNPNIENIEEWFSNAPNWLRRS